MWSCIAQKKGCDGAQGHVVYADISLSLSFFFTTDCPSPENWKMEGFKIAIQMLYVLMYFHFLTFYRENEEDKEMADFLKSKFPRNMKKTGIEAKQEL